MQEPTGHGGNNRGQSAGSFVDVPFGRFGRLFDLQGAMLDDECIDKIAQAMIKKDVSKPINEAEPLDENPAIPSGYTYFGQFVDHDITFDPTALNAQSVDVAGLEDFRSPALDLDNIYGRGPDDQPYLYVGDDTLFPRGENYLLALGDTIRGAPVAGAPMTPNDVLRLGQRSPVEEPARRKAVIGDKRNDENRLVAQVQATMIAFHNKVIRSDALTGNTADTRSRLNAAVDFVRWHYQWLVLWDYLDRHLLRPGVLKRVLNPGGMPQIPAYLKSAAKYPYMPVEFSGAAFRAPHSMVRPGYALNAKVGARIPPAGISDEDKQKLFHRVPIFSDKGATSGLADIRGFSFEIPDLWGIDWSFFLDIPGAPLQSGQAEGSAADAPPIPFQIPQPSYRIDANLVEPLAMLPEFEREPDLRKHSLAYRNLKRGVQMLRLPSGEQAADALGIPQSDRVPDGLIWTAGSKAYTADVPRVEDLDKATADRTAAAQLCIDKGVPLKGNTPLWYYVLREAEYFGVERKPDDPSIVAGGQHLGPVGSEIVAQTIVGLLWLDDNSFLNRMPYFQPHPELLDGGTAADFTLGKLVKWVWGA